MHELPIPARDDPGEFFKRVVSAYDAPAYVRRARRVHEAGEAVLEHCRRRRDEWLGLARTRLGTLFALAGTWEALRPLVADDEQIGALAGLHQDLRPRLRVPVEPTTSARALRRALAELCESLERFNRRWREFLAAIDLGEVNRERDGYNRYYVLEKECAVRSARLARHGFTPLPPLTTDDLARALPELPVPRI